MRTDRWDIGCKCTSLKVHAIPYHLPRRTEQNQKRLELALKREATRQQAARLARVREDEAQRARYVPRRVAGRRRSVQLDGRMVQ